MKKSVPCPRIDHGLWALNAGSTINIWGRKLKIVGCADSVTKAHADVERAAALLRDSQIAGAVMAAAQERGLRLIELKSIDCGIGVVFSGVHAVSALLEVAGDISGMTVAKYEETEGLINKIASKELCSVCGPDSTLLIIKPHAVAQGHAPAIVEALSGAGLTINGVRMLHMDIDRSETFFAVYKGIIKEYSQCVAELASMPCIVMDLCSFEDGMSHQILRDLCGPYDVEIARLVYFVLINVLFILCFELLTPPTRSPIVN